MTNEDKTPSEPGKNPKDGEFYTALQSGKERLEYLIETSGPWDVKVGETYCILGNVYSRVGMHRDALAMYEKGVDIMRKTLCDDDSRLAGTRYNIGLVCCKLRRFRRALPHLEQALMARTAALGPQHPDVADTLICVGGALAAQGRHADALERYDAALTARCAALGPDHPSITVTLRSSAVSLRSLGQHAVAAEREQRVHAMLLRQLGPDHPWTMDAARAADGNGAQVRLGVARPPRKPPRAAQSLRTPQPRSVPLPCMRSELVCSPTPALPPRRTGPRLRRPRPSRRAAAQHAQAAQTPSRRPDDPSRLQGAGPSGGFTVFM